ncbi:MAG: phenylalanine--tRNA ligase subunit alpha [Patescibacteria group bacterium]|nr:phenylalanine--tRNA ligase subunit alpha [Patescibacteria group bacterium]
MKVLEKIEKIQKEAQQRIKNVQSIRDLEDLEKLYLGKRGELTEITKSIPSLKEKERPKVGKKVNQAKSKLETTLKNKRNELKESGGESRGEVWLDVTLPGKKPKLGHLHPVTQTIHEIEDIFHRLGFVRRRYPEVETDWYAFESLNMPPNHPARDEWETFYIENPKFDPPAGGRSSKAEYDTRFVLTPHTSNGQVREMERVGVPVRMINISRCDRRQSDVSHIPTFYQFEGLVVDKDINITHLKGTLDFFVKEYFGEDREYRLRPYDFRFTEPSFEIDISCGLCHGKGCRYCTGGWSELGGAGMVHPQVLKNGSLDPKKVSGFAFGWGVERVFMMRENLNISDIRVLYENDIRFLRQF